MAKTAFDLKGYGEMMLKIEHHLLNYGSTRPII